MIPNEKKGVIPIAMIVKDIIVPPERVVKKEMDIDVGITITVLLLPKKAQTKRDIDVTNIDHAETTIDVIDTNIDHTETTIDGIDTIILLVINHPLHAATTIPIIHLPHHNHYHNLLNQFLHQHKNKTYHHCPSIHLV